MKALNIKNDYTIIGESVYIHLSNKKGQKMDTIIDLEYLDKALKYHWNIRYEKDWNDVVNGETWEAVRMVIVEDDFCL